MSAPVLDLPTYNHLLNWCCGQSHEPYDLATIMIRWLATLDDDEKARALNEGWPWVRDRALYTMGD